MMQGYNILLIQDEMQNRIDELEKALGELCSAAEGSIPESSQALKNALSVLEKKIQRRGGNLSRGRRT